MPNIFAKKGKGKDSTKFLENARQKLEYVRKLGEAQRIKTIKELEEFAEKEEIDLETLIKDARIQIVDEKGKKEILQFRRPFYLREMGNILLPFLLLVWDCYID